MMRRVEVLAMKERCILLIIISLYFNFLDVDGSGRTSCACLQKNWCKGETINKYQHLIDEKRQSILEDVCPVDCCTTEKSFSEFSDFSWTVELLDEGKRFFCFGTIVHQRVVMTAAVCASYNRKIYIRFPLTDDITEVTNKEFHRSRLVALLTVKRPMADMNKAIFPEESSSSVFWDTCEWEGITKQDICNPNSLCKNQKSRVKFSMGAEVSLKEVQQLYDSKNHCLAGNGGPIICKHRNIYVLAGLIVQDSKECSRWVSNFTVVDTKFIHKWVTDYLSSKHLKVFPTQAYKPDVLQPITTCQSEHLTTGEAPTWLLDIIILPKNRISPPVFKCSASLIHRQVALTAAKCVLKESNDVTYYIGTAYDRNPIQEITEYETMQYISLIFLQEPFDCNAKTCLPEISSLFKWNRCFVLGRQSPGVSWENVTTQAKAYSNTERCKNNLHCEIKYRNIYSSSITSPGEHWKSVKNRKDGRYKFHTSESPCIANSGSPLMCKTEANGYIQSGVVIQNGECSQWKNWFNVFELSNKTLKWIKGIFDEYRTPAPLIPDCIQSDTITKHDEFPWMLAIFKIHRNYKDVGERIEGKKTFLCAATLVSSHVALTARECLSSVTSEDVAAGALIVRARVWKLNHEVEYSEHQDRHVQGVRKFAGYNSLYKENDIALIFWKEPLNLRTVTIEDETDDLSQTKCLAIGWGHYNKGDGIEQQAVLRKVAVPVLDTDTCHIRIQASPYLNMTTILRAHLDTFLCAGGEENRDTCHSDRGGPLICPTRNDNSKYFQAGLLSASIGCGLEGIPALYTNVQDHAEVINLSIMNIENGIKD